MRGITMVCCLVGVIVLQKASAQDSLFTPAQTESQLWREDGNDRDGADLIEDEQLCVLQPVDLNSAGLDLLNRLPGLLPAQAQAILQHRERFGPLRCIEELQVIAELSVAEIRRLAPYLRVSHDPSTAFRTSTPRQELVFRIAADRGVWNGTDTSYAHKAGDGFRSLLRYRMALSTDWLVGLRLEKDPGEAWLDDRKRPDYIAGFLSYQGKGLVRRFILGDFAIQYGQGIVSWIGFGTGFTSDPAMLRRQARGILPYTSSDENAGLRGMAVSLGGKHLEADFFVSRRARDAASGRDGSDTFASIQTSGIHSTPSELQSRSSLPWALAGTHFNYKGTHSSLGLTGLYQHHRGTLEPAREPYAYFRTLPADLFALSADGTIQWQHITGFFETGWRRNILSGMIGLQAALGKRFNAGLQFRRYGPGLLTWCSDAPAENTRSEHETGVLLTMQARFLPTCTLQVLLQKAEFSWLRFGINAPADVDEQQVVLIYNPSRKTQFRIRYRRKEYPTDRTVTRESGTAMQMRQGFRIGMTSSLPPFLALETRLEHLRDGEARGWLAFTDWSVRPLRSPVSGTLRFAVAETSSYEAAVYSQEPDLLYGFSMPAYYGSMFRIAGVIKCRLTKSIGLSVKCGWTRRAGSEDLDVPDGRVEQDFALQLRWNHGAR